MENASKALIIAGSILISILLISVGLVVFKSTSGMVDQTISTSESMAISMFNQRFSQYFGSSVSGSQAKALVNAVITNNSMPENNKIYLNLYNASATNINPHSDTLTELNSLLNNISVASKYKIEPTPSCTDERCLWWLS